MIVVHCKQQAIPKHIKISDRRAGMNQWVLDTESENLV